MAVQDTVDPRSLLIDKHELRRLMDRANERMGFVLDDTATPEKAQARTLSDGVRPEDCVASRELMRMRYADRE